MTALNFLRKWFVHGLKIVAGGFGAYLVAVLPFAIVEMVSEITSENFPLGAMFALMGLVVVPLSIAGFGFLFTKLYTNSTWGYDAVRDMKAHECSGSAITEKPSAMSERRPRR